MRKTIFCHVFKSKNAPLGVRIGSTAFEDHVEADIKSALITPVLQKQFVSVGKMVYRDEEEES